MSGLQAKAVLFPLAQNRRSANPVGVIPAPQAVARGIVHAAH